MRPPPDTVSWRRLAVVGVSVATLVIVTGFVIERIRFGGESQAAIAGLARDVERMLTRESRQLQATTATLMANPQLAIALSEGPAAARTLFMLLDRVGATQEDTREAITLYSFDNQVVAWVGRASTLPAQRLNGPAALFVAPGPIGLRLVYVEPVTIAGQPRRAGTIASERLLSPVSASVGESTDYTLETSFGTVTLVPRYEQSGATATLENVVLRGSAGEPLLEIRVDPAQVTETRAAWRGSTLAIAACVIVGTLLLIGAPIANWRLRGGYLRFVVGTLALCGIFVGSRVLLWWAFPQAWVESTGVRSQILEGAWIAVLLRSPLDILAHGLLALGLVGIGATSADRLRVCARQRRIGVAKGVGSMGLFVGQQLVAGLAIAVLVISFAIPLGTVVENATVDVLHLSFHPYDYPRLALLVGLVLLHAAMVWAAVVILITSTTLWRVPPGVGWKVVLLVCWATPVLVITAPQNLPWVLPPGPLFLTVTSAGLLALLWRRGAPWFRRTSRAARVIIAVLALIIPCLLLYPLLAVMADRAKQRLIEEQFATETLALPRTLLARLDEAQRQIDRIPNLPDLLVPGEELPGIQTETAFAVWRRTALGAYRLTSAVEMYNADGQLVSRFALNLPEYQPRAQQYRASSCTWDVFGEATPFGSEERRMLHAERGICDAAGQVVGALVLHVMPDYATLSFISSQNPYFQIFSDRSTVEREDVPGSDVGLVIYGWGRSAIYTTLGRAWPLDDALFSRLYRSNQGFWTTLALAGTRSHVYFVSDRNGIYALAYPVPSWFDHSVHLAELATLGAFAAVIALLAASVLQRLAWRQPWTVRQLLREIRTSFSRKLFLAFVAATVIPVLILAVAIRAYVASKLQRDIEAEAARTAAAAQRVIEETLSFERRTEIASPALDDDALVWISRIINQAVNVYVGPQLAATSERDLFASGQLPTRTPDAVYRAIAIDRLPSYVGEDEIAGLRYLMAATPVNAGNRDAVLTVPFTLRQREIEREIDELDRGVQLGALVFIVLGAAIGYWLADRISDPVQRLTRASRRIAAGDLDTRVFVRSADELRRLVEAFNKMAWELQRQRTQLERTNRLEAWAEMARQVAHDIKNPLTPIQLSAEHLRRVHRDRGEPLAPVLDACVDTILSQVRLLRQIAGEFSSFASTPVPRPVPTNIRGLLQEVADAYAVGLAGRVDIAVDVDPRTPEVEIDRTLVGRAITNIVENALNAMPSGGSLRLSARAGENGAAVVTVTDTGIGIDEEALRRMFEPYFSTKATGTGLGLTIAKRNIELHGGTITISSQKGVGTRVSFTLPHKVSALQERATGN